MGRGAVWVALLFLSQLTGLSTPATALAQPGSTLTVSSVLDPIPPGSPPDGEIFLRATVRAIGLRPTTVMFYLAQAKVPGPGDILLATATVKSAPPPIVGPRTIDVTAHVGSQVPPGLYFVLACADAGSHCAASRGTIQIMREGLSPVDQSAGTIPSSPPFTEYFPEVPTDGMTVGQPFPCPLSIHGQWPSSCVYVTTKNFDIPENTNLGGLMYCPADRPYPFQVAIGFDPLWLDKTVDTVPARTNAVSFTKYKINSFGMPYSYTGFDATSRPPNRGYAAFYWTGCTTCGDGTGQVQFLCSNKATSRAAE